MDNPNDSFVNKAIGASPTEVINIGGAQFDATIDTGSRVTTLSETLAKTRLPQCQVRDLQWIEVTGANGLPVPLRGFIETTITVGVEH